jgi:hypothetical protein
MLLLLSQRASRFSYCELGQQFHFVIGMAKSLSLLLHQIKPVLYSTPVRVLSMEMVEVRLKVLRKLAGEQLYLKVALAKVSLILSFS